MSAPLVRVRGAVLTRGSGPAAVRALRGVDLDVHAGELVALVGRSGAGKSSLLHVVGGLTRPDAGEVVVDGVDVARAGEGELLRLRRDVVAFVLQGFGLLPLLTAAENAGLPLRVRGVPADVRERRVAQVLDLLGLGPHAAQRPAEMSGGQQQRVAVARALAASPRLLLADEPTGQLDAETGLAVMALVRGVVEAEGTAALVATHDPVMVALADRAVRISDGRLVDEPLTTEPLTTEPSPSGG
jgi:putative ABC transport system ATP-binding protein